MRLSVFGLGYVGCVSAGCFADDGHKVVGVDKNQTKIDIINSGRSPIIERDIGDIIRRNVENGSLYATMDAHKAIAESEVSLICVGTPSNGNGSLDFKHIRRVCEEIGEALRDKDSYHVVAIRSTVLPGVAREIAIPALEEASGKKVGEEIAFCVNPEFLREGSSVYDFYNPPKTVIGEFDERSGQKIEVLYKDLEAPLFRIDIDSASMIKYADNAFHAVKVTFANEIGRLCKKFAVDSRIVMEIFCEDKKLNISPVYLRPGYAFGGSCLPKDLRAITYRAKQEDVEVPMIQSAIESNKKHVEAALTMIRESGKKHVGFLGMSFKAGTDDLRESPVVTAIEFLIGKGYDVSIFDRNVSIAKLMGSNKEYIEREIPHISRLMRQTAEEVVNESEVIVLGNAAPEHKQVLQDVNGTHKIIDLVGLYKKEDEVAFDYEGICW